MKYFVWSLLVWVPLLLLIELVSPVRSCPQTGGCFGLSSEGGLLGSVVIAAAIYVIGLFLIHLWNLRGRG